MKGGLRRRCSHFSREGLPRRSPLAEAHVAALGRTLCAALFTTLCALACSDRAAPVATNRATLPAGTLARAGSELVSVSTVSRVVAAQGVSPRIAANLAITDALFASAARAELSPTTTRSFERAAAARALLEQLRQDAELAGPPTAAELSSLVQERWAELDRPDAVRTTHAVVMNDKPARDSAARAVADKLAAALAHVTSAAELLAAANAFPGEGFEIRAEELPFCTADGRVLQRKDSGFVAVPGAFDADFARAASSIAQPGQLSGVVKSPFGYHVIRLEERAPGVVVPQAELPSLLGSEVLVRRARRSQQELTERLKAGVAVQIDRAADELTSQVKVTL